MHYEVCILTLRDSDLRMEVLSRESVVGWTAAFAASNVAIKQLLSRI